MANEGDTAEDVRMHDEQIAILASGKQKVGIVWRERSKSKKGKRKQRTTIKHFTHITTRYRAKQKIEDEGDISFMTSADWAIAYYLDGEIEWEGDPTLFDQAERALNHGAVTTS